MDTYSAQSNMYWTNQHNFSKCFIKTKHCKYIMKQGSATVWFIFHLRFTQSDFGGQRGT